MRTQCAFGAAAMTALADYATTRAGDDRLPHAKLFLHRHEDRRCRVVKVLRGAA